MNADGLGKILSEPRLESNCGCPEIGKRKQGAVMVIFMSTKTGPALLFTKRAPDLEEHAGQISFPGGALEPSDAGHLSAALRETDEEVGIGPEELQVLSPLPLQPVLSSWMIFPFVAWWLKPRALCFNKSEVEQIIMHPLDDLLRQHQAGCWLIADPEHSCRYQLDGEVLWGATAKITGRLLDRLAASA